MGEWGENLESSAMVWRQWGCGAWGRHRETVCAAALDEGAHEARLVSRHVVRFSREVFGRKR